MVHQRFYKNITKEIYSLLSADSNQQLGLIVMLGPKPMTASFVFKLCYIMKYQRSLISYAESALNNKQNLHELKGRKNKT